MSKIEFGNLFLEPLRNGVTKPKKVRGTGFKMVNMGEIFSLNFIQNNTMDRVPLTDKEKTSLLKNNDLLFARQSLVRDGAGKCSIFLNDDEPVCFESHIIRARLNPELCYSMFYYYFFSSSLGKNTMDKIIEQGAGAAGIRGSDLSKLEVPYIEYDKQKEIAETLYTYDQKIQLNTQINQTLEQIAQAIFKSWFVDFDPVRAKAVALESGKTQAEAELAAMQAISGKTVAELTALQQTQPEKYQELAEIAKAFPSEFGEDGVPMGWESKPLGEFISFVKGKKPKTVSATKEENMLPHILAASLEGKYTEYCEINKLVTVEYQHTIMLMDGSNSGRIAIGHNGVIGSTLAKVAIEKKELWAIIYHFLKFKEDDIKTNTTGTTIPHTDKNRVNNYLLVIPCNAILARFTTLFNNSLLEIISNREMIIQIERVRDLLLPRLLNGEP